MKDALDNTALIQKFLNGDDALLANRELHTEKALDETQLLTNQGILLAKRRVENSAPTVKIRLQSDYWERLHQLALESSLIPFQLDQARFNGDAFVQYDYHSTPAGYQVHCQEASAFWKTWWVNHRKLELMDMLLLCNKRWSPINKIVCETGTIYVKTWQGEKKLAISDTVVWLDRNTQGSRKRIQVPRYHCPSTSAVDPHPCQEEEELSQPKTPIKAAGQLTVPPNLRRVVRAGYNKLLVQTAIGPVIIEGQNLTCTLGRPAAKRS